MSMNIVTRNFINEVAKIYEYCTKVDVTLEALKNANSSEAITQLSRELSSATRKRDNIIKKYGVEETVKKALEYSIDESTFVVEFIKNCGFCATMFKYDISE